MTVLVAYSDMHAVRPKTAATTGSAAATQAPRAPNRIEELNSAVFRPRVEVGMVGSQDRLVLLVEDDPGIREAVGEILRDHGYRVHAAKNGHEGLEQLRSASPKPNVILLDLMMPVMDGWQFRAEQLKLADCSDIPVVVITAFGGIDHGHLRIDADRILRKPITAKRLLDALDGLCPVPS